MKLINKFKSPNFDNRKFSKIDLIIIHYTALKDYQESISYLCNPANKVSCHFLISQKGKIYSLVDENKRAWHAGISYWNNYRDINSKSFGIELDYSEKFSNNNFNLDMMRSLKTLIRYLIKKYNIKNYNILGHSDVAPFRKKDPGRYFPWNNLIKSKLIYNPKIKNILKKNDVLEWFKKNKIISKKQKAIFILSFLGYDTSEVKKNKYLFKLLLVAYQSRYIQDNINGSLDEITFNFLMQHYCSFILTKNKKKL